MLKPFIHKVVERKDLSLAESSEAMAIILAAQATPVQIGALLVALRMKGESVDELIGFASTMREKATPVHCTNPNRIDTCGTGGDGSGTFNISTAVAFVAAGAGATVVKHGNRSVSSICGSADVLKALGVNIEAPPPIVELCVKEIGIGFLFAPLFHPAMQVAALPRREIGLRTAFNLLGPVTNPAFPTRQVVGVYNASLTEMIAQVLGRLGAQHIMVVSSEDGLDEISLSAPTKVTELVKGEIRTYTLSPKDFGNFFALKSDYSGGDPGQNARILQQVLSGVRGPHRDVVLLNSAAALYVAGIARDLKEGITLAKQAIDSGQTLQKLQQLIRLTNEKAS